jgi:glc operon protein GlcG
MTAVEGAVPIVTEGKTVGAIGVSGATSEQDGQIASAGAAALK